MSIDVKIEQKIDVPAKKPNCDWHKRDQRIIRREEKEPTRNIDLLLSGCWRI